MSRPVSHVRRCLLIAAAVIAACGLTSTCPSNVAGDESADAHKRGRRYAAGPLTAADFQAEIPQEPKFSKDVELRAFAISDILFEYEYKHVTRGRRTTVTLTSVKVFAVAYPDRSWIVDATDQRLMDHEQGHFDITQRHALRAEIELRKMLEPGRPLEIAGRDEQAAVEVLVNRLNEALAPHIAAATEENEQYDVVTQHGLRRDEQARQRSAQVESLRALNAELMER